MKKTWKKLLSFMLVLIMLFGAIPVEAASSKLTDVPKAASFTLYASKDTGFGGNKKNVAYLYSIPSSKVSNIKSSKKTVATVTKKTFYGSTFLYLNLKKAGKTNISFKYKSKTYNIAVTVQKYKNPIASVKIGKTTLASSKFKNTSSHTLKYSKYANKKQQIKITLAKGWKLETFETFDLKTEDLKKVSGFYYSQKGWAKTSDIMSNKSSVTIKGGKGYTITIPVVNSKTGQKEQVDILFK